MTSLGFQTEPDADNFRACLTAAAPGARSRAISASSNGRKFKVGAFPISIDAGAFALEARLAERNILVKRMRASLVGRPMMIGVDRLDYSKGIKHRIEAFAACLENYPNVAKARATMLQITPKSRSEIPEYERIRTRSPEKSAISTASMATSTGRRCAISTRR